MTEERTVWSAVLHVDDRHFDASVVQVDEYEGRLVVIERTLVLDENVGIAYGDATDIEQYRWRDRARRAIRDHIPSYQWPTS